MPTAKQTQVLYALQFICNIWTNIKSTTAMHVFGNIINITLNIVIWSTCQGPIQGL